ncbi:MAG: hypothetical protein ACRC8S_04500 [Fimbriiglobus sp.]
MILQTWTSYFLQCLRAYLAQLFPQRDSTEAFIASPHFLDLSAKQKKLLLRKARQK